LRDISDAEQRKTLFLGAVAPLIEAENAAIAAERAQVEAWISAGETGRALSLAEQGRRDLLARRYGAPYSDLEELLRRIDGVPVSLALAQAVLATGWGGSDAAINRNALFGRRPSDAEDETDGDPTRFRTLRASVRDYLLTLNTRPEFESFRAARAAQREAAAPLSAQTLAPHLAAYAASGEAYTRSLMDLIAENDLERFDGAAPEAPSITGD
jgi:uncharacterized FlgJ-related protein